MTRYHSYAGAMAVAAMLQIHVQGFAPSSLPGSTRIGTNNNQIATNQRQFAPTTISSSSSSFLRSTNGNDGSSDNNGARDEEAQRLQDKAKQYRAEAEKLRLTLGLQKIDELEKDIREFMKGGDDGAASESSSSSSKKRESDKLQELKDRVEDLVRGSLGKEEAEKMLSSLSAFAPKSTAEDSSSSSSATIGTKKVAVSLTESEIKDAISFLGTLPAPVKDTLAKAAGYPNYDAILNLEEFVANLYLQENTSMERLRRLYYQSFSQNLPGAKTTDEIDEEYEIRGMTELLASAIEDQIESATRAMDLFPRTVQDMEDGLPTERDARIVFEACERSFMATEQPAKVNGGYIIRGVNKRKSASELLDYLDGKIAKRDASWKEKFQVNFVEIYSDANEELFEDALLVTPNQFPPLAPAALAFVTTGVSLFSSFVYAIDTFGENPAVMEKLRGAAEVAQNGGVYDLTWFNELLIPLLVTLGAAQGFHELAHLSVAWLKQIKLTAPTILPSQSLPYLSFQNRIKTSPKGYADLFDLAFVGPIAGLTVSFIALLGGLQLTTTVDPATAQLLPSLPVGYLTQSTLGGTIVDLVLGGGDGILINQDAATQVPLHPVAVAGFLGLVIHALDLVPVGSTDGGRMSQAVLGRVWHLTFSSLVFIVLLFSSFTSNNGVLLGFLLVNSFTQRDMEIPCRNEVDKVELPRAVAALVAWILAALILVPLR